MYARAGPRFTGGACEDSASDGGGGCAAFGTEILEAAGPKANGPFVGCLVVPDGVVTVIVFGFRESVVQSMR